MSDSKYLPYQNPFSELETECNPSATPVVEEPDCPPCPSTCEPNPDAIVPDWTKRRSSEAFLNERTCQYWITSRAAFDESGNVVYYTSTGGDALSSRMQQYIEPAVTSFLISKGKSSDSATVSQVMSTATAEDYYLSDRPGIKMRVLVSLPHDILDLIPDATTSDFESGEKSVNINLSTLKSIHRAVTNILSLYSRYQGLWSKTEGGAIVFEDNKILNLLDEHNNFKQFPKALLDFIQSQDIDCVESVTLDFTENMILKTVTIIRNRYSDPIVLDDKKIESLKQTFPFNNPTTMGYVANINHMADDASARGGPKPWLEFVEEYTYPKILVYYGTGSEDLEVGLAGSVGASNTVDNLNLGDVFGNLFENLISLPDSLSYLYDQSLSMTPEQRAEMLKNLNDANLIEQLKDEALFNEFFDNADIFSKLPETMKEVTNIKEFFTEIFDNLKVCGLLKLMSSAVESLSVGLDFEELLEQSCTSAIKSMDPASLEKVWVKLPALDIEAIMAKISLQIGVGALAPWDFLPQTSSGENNGFGGTSDSGNAISNYGLAPSIGASSLSTDVSINLEVYISAILSYYSETDFGNLLDALNKLPGAQVVANIISLVDVPTPPLFGPNIMDNIKSLDLDFGRNTISITLPDMRSPMAWLPNLKDYFKSINVIAKNTIEEILMAALKSLIVKILELLYEATSNITGSPDDQAAALASGEQANLFDMVKDSFCNPDSTDAEVENTLNGLMATLGVTDSDTAGELSSTDGLNSLVIDISAVLTEEEMADLILGNPTSDCLSLIQEIVEIENPSYKPSFANKAQIASVFRNVGSLLPKDFKRDLKERVRPRLKPKPSSPTICSSPQDLENWKNARATLLKHNADLAGDTVTDEQIEEQWDKLRDRIKDDFDAISNILQKGTGQFLQDALPPFMSSGASGAKDPDCPDCPDPQEVRTALMPRTPEKLNQVLAAGTNTLLGGIEAAFVSDLLGRKGFANMLLSDTLAMPYTRHNSRVGSIFSPLYVHTEDQEHDGILGKLQSFLKSELIQPGDLPGLDPLGMFPSGVASHLRNELVNLRDASFATNVNYVDDLSTIASTLGTSEDQLLASGVAPTKEPDLILEFRDNNRDGAGTGAEYSYGFDINFEYWTYTYDGGAPVVNTEDVSQIRIIDRNQSSLIEQELPALSFISKSTLSSMANSEKSKYDLSGAKFSPQIECFGQVLMESLRQSECDDAAIESIGTSFAGTTEFWDNIMSRALAYFAAQIADDEILWSHGWEDDKITDQDLFYLEPNATSGQSVSNTLYGSSLSGLSGAQYLEAVKAKKQVGPLGVSARVDDSGNIIEIPHPRVTFLDPLKYGGDFMRPPYYVAPAEPTGWVGILQALSPPVSGCDPQPKKLISFADINKRVSEVFDNLADDPRLALDQDCVKELPYARILDRTAASNIEGVLSALIRIYTSEEFMKAMPIFGKFSLPTAGSIFADYITEKMSEDIKNNTVRLGLFRDQKYWYSLLEQAVQIYGRRVDAGEIQVTSGTQQALNSLNDFQVAYAANFPSESNLEAAQQAGTEIMGDSIKASTSLKEYRQLKVFEAIQQTELDAKVIFSAMVQEQLEFMSNSAKETLSPIGINPSIDNLKKYFLGTSGMCLGSNLEIDLPEEQRRSAAPTIMDVGNILQSYGAEANWSLTSPLSQLDTIDPKDLEAGFFFLEKYVIIEDLAEASTGTPIMMDSIPSEIYNRSEQTRGVTSLYDWQEFVNSLIDNPSVDTSVPLSKYFGNLSLDGGNNLEGSVGVRYGLRLSYALPESLSATVKAADLNLNSGNTNAVRDRTYSPASSNIDTQEPVAPTFGNMSFQDLNDTVNVSADLLIIPLVSTEIDALDMAIDDYGTYTEGAFFGQPAIDSYDASCMAELMVKEPRLELLLEYIFPLEKLQGLLAIYTARGFVPSVGEDDGWESFDDRKDIGSFAGAPKFDNWDQNKTFIKSKEQCRRLFKAMWKSREFSFTDDDSHDVQTNFSENMRDSFGLQPEQDVSWYMRDRSRSNPFDKDGNEC